MAVAQQSRSPVFFIIGLGVVALIAVAGCRRASTPDVADTVEAPRATAVAQTTEKTLVSVRLPKGSFHTLRVELLGPDGSLLAKGEATFKGHFDKPADIVLQLPALRHAVDQVTVRCTLDDKKHSDVPLGPILLVKAHETSLAAGQEFYAGSPAVIRCAVHGVKSVTESVPLPEADVAIKLQAKDGKAFPLYEGKTGANGVADASFKLPAIAAGQYTLLVATKSTLGEEKLERDVRIKADPKILLVTDKPLYQPGQLMHIRALALQAFDLKPVSGSDLVFEVEDSKGNKVFKRTHKTSEYGVAAVDFQLADEVNMGDYQVRAILEGRAGDVSPPSQAQKTVAVRKYVLPKFKVELSTDKRYYLPKDTVQAKLQSDYFFGKPVAGGKIKVTASTFDVQFREFQTWEGKTDANGHATFEIKLPDYFVGQPLQKGDALVRLEVKLTDTADHTETIGKTYPVSDQSIRVSLIPEGGRLVPEMENRIYVAAIYPDGSPAACDVKLWVPKAEKKPASAPEAPGVVQPEPIPPPGAVRAPPPAAPKPEELGEPVATLKTNEAGLAEFRFTPKPEHWRITETFMRQAEMLGGQQIMVTNTRSILQVFAEAKDAKGSVARSGANLTSEPFGENVVLRLDKAIYRAGDSIRVDLRSSAGLPTAYLDIIKGGQVLLSKWLDVKDGQASHKLDLPAGIFGTLEVHAYQMLSHGEIIRDSRVVYVQPADGLKIEVKADKDVYLPGQEGKIRFQVTDAKGNPAAAALGVIIVDEAVYALQDMQPGLEKVYFTLQEELLKPQVQIVYKPSDTIHTLVREPELPVPKQQIAEVLLTSVKPKPPARWEVNPAFERRQKFEQQLKRISIALFVHGIRNNLYMEYDKGANRWRFKPDLLAEIAKAGLNVTEADLVDPFGRKLTIEELATHHNNFTVDRLARAITQSRMQTLVAAVASYSSANQATFLRGDKWEFPETLLSDAATKHYRLDPWWLVDAWGEPIKLVKREKKRDNQPGHTQFDYHELVSAGPDRKFGTEDDVKMGSRIVYFVGQFWLYSDADSAAPLRALATDNGDEVVGLGAGAPAPLERRLAPPTAEVPKEAKADAPPAGGDQGGAAQPIRVREYFPETLLWKPAVITDDKGHAELSLDFADSITTWRLSASASSKGGALGGVSAPLRVFQDFFVDLDLPVSLTQNDEVAFPVAVYNYLKEPQTVKLELQQESWFELIAEPGALLGEPGVSAPGGLTRSLDLKPNEVTSVKFRIKAKKIGQHPLLVKATGSKTSDAIKRSIEVVPDGRKIEQVASDSLKGRVKQTVEIPEQAIPDSYKLMVKVYPGVFSQVLEGTEGMLRLPGG